MSFKIKEPVFEVDLNAGAVKHKQSIETEAGFVIPPKYKYPFPFCHKVYDTKSFGRVKCELTGHFVAELKYDKPKEVEIREGQNLIEFSVDSHWGLKQDITINSQEYVIQLRYNPSAVKDFVGIVLDDDVEIPIKFTFKIVNQQNGQMVYEESDSIILKAKRINSYPEFTYTREKSELKFVEKQEQERIGFLNVRRLPQLQCAPPLTNLWFSIASFISGNDDEDNDDVHGLFLIEDNKQQPVNFSNGRCHVAELTEKSKIELPIVFNWENATNPCEATKYGLKVKEHPTSQILATLKDVLAIQPNKTVMKLDVGLILPMEHNKRNAIGGKSDVEAGSYELPRVENVEEEQGYYRFVLDFRNTAQARDPKHPDAQIVIGDYRIESIQVEKGRNIYMRHGIGLADSIKLSDENRVPIDGSVPIRLKHNQSKKLYFHLYVADFVDIPPSEQSSYVSIDVNISYNYILDFDGKAVEEGRMKHEGQRSGSHSLHLHLGMTPYPEWLSVDLGTSALVASYASCISKETSPIKLKDIKDQILLKAYPDVEDRRKNDDETNAYLISSTMCLNDTSTKAAKAPVDGKQTTDDYRRIDDVREYSRFAFWFSPSSNTLKLDYLLPCMKLLIGYKYLPNVFSEGKAKAFQYFVNGVRTSLMTVEEIEKGKKKSYKYSELMLVDNIFTLAYTQMFKHYFADVASRAVHKLVLTVPNTYSMENISRIKQIAKAVMPSIYPEYLCTVSESDAVACYYANATDLAKDASERILIYDMGAGTLDLTYLERKYEGNRQILDIKGKMGVNKAGNYLDYVLAEILVELRLKSKEDIKESDKATMKGILDLDEVSEFMSDRNAMKRYVRNELKPMLSKANSDQVIPQLPDSIAKCFVSKNGKAIKISDILNSEAYKQYVKDTTSTVLTHFAKLLGQDTIEVDRLIFSGRSSSLEAIRQGVQDCLGMTNNDVVFDLAGTNKHTDLKNVVTLGALAYSTMFNSTDGEYMLRGRSNYAIYGIIVSRGKDTNWYPLVTPMTHCVVNQETGIEESVGEIDLDMKNVNTVNLVQTYSATPKEDFQRGDMSMITVLHTRYFSNYSGRISAELCLARDAHGNQLSTISYKIQGQDAPIVPKEKFNNDTLRKSLWPVVFPVDTSNEFTNNSNS